MENFQLKNAYIHITNACEFSCPFCYAVDIKTCDNKIFPAKNILAVVDKIKDTTIENVSLVGGNPILHPDISTIINYIKDKTSLNLILMTNTADFSLNGLESCYSKIDVLMVTVHSDNARGHDEITKKTGSYSKLIECLLKFQNLNSHSKIKIAINITPYSYNRIYSIASNLIKCGININEIILQRIAPVSLTRMNEKYLVDAKQANIALSQALQIRDELHIEIDLVDPFPLCFVDEKNKEVIVPCKCGKSDININGNGDVSRCGADPHYQLGNIFETPLEQIWNSQELKSFRKREYLPQECALCKDKIICGGGCPMSVIAYNTINKSHLDMFRKKNK